MYVLLISSSVLVKGQLFSLFHKDSSGINIAFFTSSNSYLETQPELKSPDLVPARQGEH